MMSGMCFKMISSGVKVEPGGHVLVIVEAGRQVSVFMYICEVFYSSVYE